MSQKRIGDSRSTGVTRFRAIVPESGFSILAMSPAFLF